MNKYVFMLVIIMIMIPFSLVKADSGFDSSYDSGYSGGSYSSDYSSVDYDYGSNSSYGSSGNPLFDFLILLVLFSITTIIFIAKLIDRQVESGMSKRNDKLYDYSDISDDKLKKINFSYDSNKLKDEFFKLLNVYFDNINDRDNIKNIISEEVYNITTVASDRKRIIENIDNLECNIYSATEDSIKVYYLLSLNDYLVDNDNDVVDGYYDNLKFIRYVVEYKLIDGKWIINSIKELEY